MTFVVLLGHRINDDGTITKTMEKRLNLCYELNKQFNPDYIIVSGGQANKAVDFSESYIMRKKLIEMGINEEKIIEENNSMTTLENAIYSLKIMEQYDVNNIIICSTYSHFLDYNAIKYFHDEINKNQVIKNKHVRLMIYTDPEEINA